MDEDPIGLVLEGESERIRASYEAFRRVPIDLDLWGEPLPELPKSPVRAHFWEKPPAR